MAFGNHAVLNRFVRFFHRLPSPGKHVIASRRVFLASPSFRFLRFFLLASPSFLLDWSSPSFQAAGPSIVSDSWSVHRFRQLVVFDSWSVHRFRQRGPPALRPSRRRHGLVQSIVFVFIRQPGVSELGGTEGLKSRSADWCPTTRRTNKSSGLGRLVEVLLS